MEPVRFDALAKSLATSRSRRGVLKGMAAAFVATLLRTTPATEAQQPPCPAGLKPCDSFCYDLMNDRRHCGTCKNQCALAETCFQGACTQAICTAGPIDCWGNFVDPRTDPQNCGQCGEVCAAGKGCSECACEEPNLLAGACRSEQLGIWVNAFLPGFIPGLTRIATVDGVSRAVFEMDTDSGDPIVLLADRDPNPRFSQTPFSADLNAPGIAQLALGITLPGMVAFTPELHGGVITQLNEVSEQDYESGCSREVVAPLSSCARLVSSDGTRAAYDIDCRWTVKLENSPDAACALDAQTFPPVRIQGRLELERADATGLVEVRFTALDEPESNVRVSRFPAFEMYARLDDGNQVAVFQHAPDGGWVGGSLVEVADELGQQCGEDECEGVVARLGCGCGTTCIDGQECFVDQSTGTKQCRWLDGYYVLSGGTVFEPNNDIVCADPRCPSRTDCTESCRAGYFNADGTVTVEVDGQTIYSSDPFGRLIVPPIGFRARPGSKVRVLGANLTGRTREGLQYLSLNRVDGPYGRLVRELRPDTGNQLAVLPDGRTSMDIEIRQPRSTQGSTICCRDQGQQVCVDRMSSDDHCGGCNQPCPENMLCLSGHCICPHPLIVVGDECVDPSQDAQHCGPDLLDCTLDGRFCAQSSCVSADCQDRDGFQVCDGVCVSRQDAEHCGFYCEACRIPQNGKAICAGDVCDFECNDGFQRCGFECVDPSQPEHCGSQCTPCAGIPNATPICNPVEGDFQCGYSCNGGFHECWGECVSNFENGHCGSECTACPPESPICTAAEDSTFAMCCPENHTVCFFGCAALYADPSNCGECGKQCDPNQCCNGGTCGVCDGCGGCPSGQQCIDGLCQEPPQPPPPPPPDCGECGYPDAAGNCVYKTCPPPGVDGP